MAKYAVVLYAVVLAGIVDFPLLWPTSHNSISSVPSPPLWSAWPAASRPLRATRHHLVRGEKSDV
jgi:hypothetical protein